jgi:lysozyme family protein
MSYFDKAVELVLKDEGGYVDHPNDKGGATNFGITQATLSKHRGQQVTKQDVQGLTVYEAKDIYKKYYWTPYSLDSLKSEKLACALFNQLVNRNPQSAIKSFQRALNLADDGIIGPNTINTANALNENKVLIALVKDINLFYAGLCIKDNSQLVFLKGWLKRASKLLDLL